MMGDEEQQSISEAFHASGAAKATEPQQLDDAGRKSRRKTSKKSRTAEPTTRQSKRHTAAERADKLQRIEEALARGGVSLKAAVEAVGISDQTYYQWKRADKPAGVVSNSAAASPATTAEPSSFGIQLADLIKLDDENRRLRQLLGEKLHAENAELRRRLELD